MHTEAKIYLAGQRGCSQSDWHRSFYTFNFGLYLSESRKSFERLQALNDETLGSKRTASYQVTEDTAVLLLPVVGGLNYETEATAGFLDAGQSYLFLASKDAEFKISNPYANELISFLQIRFKPGGADDTKAGCNHEFDLDLHKNQLVSLQPEGEHQNRFFIGKFDGREEGTHRLRDSRNGVFVYILEGAFEVQNRLLEPRDGLAIRYTEEIAFEALSNEAIILVMEQDLSA